MTTLHPLDNIKTWEGGCGNTLPFGLAPQACTECTEGLVAAIKDYFVENPHVLAYSRGVWVAEGLPPVPGTYATKNSHGVQRWAWFDGVAFGGSADQPEHAYVKRNYHRTSPVVAWWRAVA